MKRFEVQFYETPSGQIPVESFLLGLDVKMRAKLARLIGILQEYGNQTPQPYSKHLKDGIYELRGQVGSDITRVLYFFYHDGIIILTNGFIKKTQKTPKEELRMAMKYRKDYMERRAQNEKV